MALHDRYHVIDLIAGVDNNGFFSLLVPNHRTIALQRSDGKNFVNHRSNLHDWMHAVQNLRRHTGTKKLCRAHLAKHRLSLSLLREVQYTLRAVLEEQSMDRIQFMTHQNQRILLVDCTNFTVEELTTIADELPGFLKHEPKNSVLLLADFTGAHFDKQSVEHIKVAAVFDRPYLKRSAWVLNENLPKALFDSIRTFSQRNIAIFHSRAEALDYLVS
jgi:hypothetical protein